MKAVYATVAILAGLILASGAVGQAPAIDSIATGAIPPASTSDGFRLLSSGGIAECRLAVGQELAGEMRPLQFGASCLADNPGLAGARYWSERPDGDVMIFKADGHIVAKFAAADGASFESYYPTLPVMTLLAVN